jgi:hypothetical protein
MYEISSSPEGQSDEVKKSSGKAMLMQISGSSGQKIIFMLSFFKGL